MTFKIKTHDYLEKTNYIAVTSRIGSPFYFFFLNAGIINKNIATISTAPPPNNLVSGFSINTKRYTATSIIIAATNNNPKSMLSNFILNFPQPTASKQLIPFKLVCHINVFGDTDKLLFPSLNF